MNFTREPIIETIITPQEGFQLVIRNSNGTSQEEYSVNSVEVVAFGKSFFFRSLEKPKSFLLPVSNYEVLETRETRSVLKKPKIEKSIKIGGGKILKSKKKEAVVKEDVLSEPSKKRSNSKTSHRRQSPKKEVRDSNEKTTTKLVKTNAEEIVKANAEEIVKANAEEIVKANAEETERSHHCTTLLPPPTTLISEQIQRYKGYLETEGVIFPKEKTGEDKKIEELPKEPTDDLSFLPQDDVNSQDPSIFEESFSEEETVIDFEKKAPASPEEDELKS